MKKLIISLVLVSAPAFSYAGHSDSDTVLGGGLGGIIGAVIGHEMGGRDGAILGGAIGAAAGVAIATDNDRYRDSYHGDSYRRYDRRETYYYHGRDRHHFYAPPHGHFTPPGHAKKRHW